ncbi:hypothetical protein OHA70_03780 [Kribbella sp. NBC_00382]|uniref:hypothetical protein n=1 Tax=Kribbella sp. NBC_00382 TaxID=2975967 RepID=UPI002E1BE6EC
MTRQLKDLMHEATDRPAFTPDVELLLATGHRRRRNRRLATAVAVAASIAVVAGGTILTLDTTDRSAPAVAPSWPLPSVDPGGSTGLCSDENGDPVPTAGASVWSWPVSLSVQDTYGISLLRRSPKSPGIVAYCTTEWGNGAKDSVVPGGGTGGIVLRKSAAVGRGLTEPGSVTTVFGQAPKNVQRVTVETEDGHVGIAQVRGGYFAYRRIEKTPWPGAQPTVIVRFTIPGRPEYIAAQR